jgi:hypothetical protein
MWDAESAGDFRGLQWVAASKRCYLDALDVLQSLQMLDTKGTLSGYDDLHR